MLGVVYESYPLVDKLFGLLLELVKIVAGVGDFLGGLTQPLHVGEDGIDILLRLCLGVGVVLTQLALAARLSRHVEAEAHGLRVADVQLSVGLRREAGPHHFAPLFVVGFPHCLRVVCGLDFSAYAT